MSHFHFRFSEVLWQVASFKYAVYFVLFTTFDLYRRVDAIFCSTYAVEQNLSTQYFLVVEKSV